MHTILLLEDDPDIRELVQMILEDEHYNVIAFGNISDFTNRDPKISADLFILDVRLPDGSGIDVCEQIMAVEDTPIIIMSAHATLEKINQSCQPSDFIPKPFDIDGLLASVKTQINRTDR